MEAASSLSFVIAAARYAVLPSPVDLSSLCCPMHGDGDDVVVVLTNLVYDLVAG